MNDISRSDSYHAVISHCSATPLFLQALDEPRKYYTGVFQSPGVETSFDMVHLHHMSEKYRHLTGLLEIFKGKLVG